MVLLSFKYISTTYVEKHHLESNLFYYQFET